VIVDSALYRDGVREAVDLDGDVLARLRESSENKAFLWVGINDPDQDEMARFAKMLGLHKLAVEDAMSKRQRPKVEPYDEMLYIVMKTLWYVEETDQVESGQVSIFLGPDFVLTVRLGRGVELTTVRQDLESKSHLLDHGPTAVVYTVVDRIVDCYEEVAEELQTDVDEVESSVFSPGRTRDSQRIYILKRELAEVRRAVQPLRVPMQRFIGADYPFLHKDASHFFRDIADHVIRVNEQVENLDLLLSSAFEAHLTMVSVQQNEDMRKISAWVAIAGVCTLVAGVYGMNFEHMPELRWELGYPFALALMGGFSFMLYRLFKRAGWL
jgi:magnesium transporter